MLGVLEQIADLEALFTHLRFCKQDVILSYHPTNLLSGLERDARGFANHLSYFDLAHCSTATAFASNAPRRSTRSRC